MIMKKLLCLIAAGALTMSLAACGEKSYKDGTYSGRSSDYTTDEEDGASNGYGEVEITIKDGKIAECTYMTYEIDGTPKGDDYGKKDGEIKNEGFYNKAQKANAARSNYAKQLVAKGSIDDVDAISGATINYNEFVEAVNDALLKAEEK